MKLLQLDKQAVAEKRELNGVLEIVEILIWQTQK